MTQEIPLKPSGSLLSRSCGFLSRVLLGTLLLWLLCVLAPLSSAAPPQAFVIQELHTTVKQHWLFADLSVSVDDEEGLRNILKDGAVLVLNISVNIQRLRSWWSNEEISAREFTSIIRHDPLTRDFQVELPAAEGTKAFRDKNLNRLLHATWRNLSISLVQMERLRSEEPGSVFQITFGFSLQHGEIPPWLEKSPVFWSSNVVPKEQISIEYSLPGSR